MTLSYIGLRQWQSELRGSWCSIYRYLLGLAFAMDADMDGTGPQKYIFQRTIVSAASIAPVFVVGNTEYLHGLFTGNGRLHVGGEGVIVLLGDLGIEFAGLEARMGNSDHGNHWTVSGCRVTTKEAWSGGRSVSGLKAQHPATSGRDRVGRRTLIHYGILIGIVSAGRDPHGNAGISDGLFQCPIGFVLPPIGRIHKHLADIGSSLPALRVGNPLDGLGIVENLLGDGDLYPDHSPPNILRNLPPMVSLVLPVSWRVASSRMVLPPRSPTF